ncbi:hypothetical protein PFISCL1PPCAC_336 [Pristionchus fissidentatus]|uniref:Calf-1 n=1 Tax=Pristionchus fissidentatus TaxID=1538716 RepID=A0AAV5UTC5_9BILA|nr:hypothetical protein PFISCL1PPCAC_336 [Pristionchus fissidentatus]
MSSKDPFTPSDEVMTTIVFPTIAFCVGLIVAMLVGINKCKQWELDKVGEMRRTRRVIERITNRLREKNFRTIQKARRVRKAAHEAAVAAAKAANKDESPPLYSSAQRGSINCGRSPPPSYEDALLDEYYNECKPSKSRRPSGVSTKYSTSTAKCRSSSTQARRRVSASAAKTTSTSSSSARHPPPAARRASRNGGTALLNNNTAHIV